MLVSVAARQQRSASAAGVSARLRLGSSNSQTVALRLASISGVLMPARAGVWGGSIRPICMLAGAGTGGPRGQTQQQRQQRQTQRSQLIQLPAHRSFANIPPPRPSTSAPRPATGRAASLSGPAAAAAAAAPSSASSAAASSFGATVAPPRLVFEMDKPISVRTKTLLNGVQALFWVGIYGAHFSVPELVPLWYGALGLTTSLAFGVAMHFRAVRTINELAIYADNQTFRLGVSDALGRPVFYDAQLKETGPNPKPRRDGSQRYWTFKVANRPGFFLMDRADGTVYDVFQLNRLLGYDIYDTVKNPADVRVWAREKQEAAVRDAINTSEPKPSSGTPQQQQPQQSNRGGRQQGRK